MKFDSKTAMKALKVGSLIVAGASLLINEALNKNERSEMKNDLKKEIMEELSKGKD